MDEFENVFDDGILEKGRVLFSKVPFHFVLDVGDESWLRRDLPIELDVVLVAIVEVSTLGQALAEGSKIGPQGEGVLARVGFDHVRESQVVELRFQVIHVVEHLLLEVPPINRAI